MKTYFYSGEGTKRDGTIIKHEGLYNTNRDGEQETFEFLREELISTNKYTSFFFMSYNKLAEQQAGKCSDLNCLGSYDFEPVKCIHCCVSRKCKQLSDPDNWVKVETVPDVEFLDKKAEKKTVKPGCLGILVTGPQCNNCEFGNECYRIQHRPKCFGSTDKCLGCGYIISCYEENHTLPKCFNSEVCGEFRCEHGLADVCNCLHT